MIETTRHDPIVIARMLASAMPSFLRAPRGVVVKGHRAKPAKLLELFEAEYCPYSRHVREALTELDLDARIYPIPRNGKRYKQRLVKLSGEAKIPFLHDPNTGTKLCDSNAIVEYLYATYGIEGISVPDRKLRSSVLATALRATQGMFAVPSRAARKPLELYSFEGSPYSRLVRELLCELEIGYVVRNVGKTPGTYADYFPPILRHNRMKNYMPGTENRRAFLARAGKMMVPYIVDPNTGVSMWETGDIQAYLRKSYGK
jgi:glutathione S-transferase